MNLSEKLGLAGTSANPFAWPDSEVQSLRVNPDAGISPSASALPAVPALSAWEALVALSALIAPATGTVLASCTNTLRSVVSSDRNTFGFSCLVELTR